MMMASEQNLESLLFVGETAARVTVLLGMAWGITALARRASASVRALVWTASIVGALALPILAVSMPSWAVLPSWMRASTSARSEKSMRLVPPVPAAVVSAKLEGAVVPTSRSRLADNSVGKAPSVPSAGTTAESSNWVLWCWGAGATLVFLWVVIGSHRLRELRRESTPVHDVEWQSLLHKSCEELGIRRRVALLTSDRCPMPMTWGGVLGTSPIVLIPSAARTWTPGRQRAVLLHELAHVQRRDTVSQLLTHVACALYWFHPLVWFARHRIAVERERACDDCVLRIGERATDYAEHLLVLASGRPPSALLAVSGIAMARSSKIEGRLQAILDDTRKRHIVGRRGMAALTAIAIAILVPVVTLRGADDPPRRTEPTVGHPVVYGPSGNFVFRFRAVDLAGKPVPGAKVEMSTVVESDKTISFKGGSADFMTDDAGCFAWETAPLDRVSMNASADGFENATNLRFSASADEQTITLKHTLTVRGTVRDAKSGESIRDFIVIPGLAWGDNQSITWDRSSVHTERGGEFAFPLRFSYPVNWIRVEAADHHAIVSEPFPADGRGHVFDFRMPPERDTVARVRNAKGEPVSGAEVFVATPSRTLSLVNGRGGVPDTVGMKTIKDGRFWVRPQDGPFGVVVIAEEGFAKSSQVSLEASGEVRLEPWARIDGQLVIAGMPQPNETIVLIEQGCDGGPWYYHRDTKTDGEGRFAFDRVPPGEASVARQVNLYRDWTNVGLWDHGQVINPKPGESISLRLGNSGRPVVGRVVLGLGDDIPVSDVFVYGKIRSALATIPRPANFDELPPDEQDAIRKTWEANPADPIECETKRRAAWDQYAVVVQPDLSFRVEDVPAGRYRLELSLKERRHVQESGPWTPFAETRFEFTVPEMPSGRDGAALDLGAIELRPTPKRR